MDYFYGLMQNKAKQILLQLAEKLALIPFNINRIMVCPGVRLCSRSQTKLHTSRGFSLNVR